MHIFLDLSCFPLATIVLQSLEQHLKESSWTFTWKYPAGWFAVSGPNTHNIVGDTWTANCRSQDTPSSLVLNLHMEVPSRMICCFWPKYTNIVGDTWTANGRSPDTPSSLNNSLLTDSSPWYPCKLGIAKNWFPSLADHSMVFIC